MIKGNEIKIDNNINISRRKNDNHIKNTIQEREKDKMYKENPPKPSKVGTKATDKNRVLHNDKYIA